MTHLCLKVRKFLHKMQISTSSSESNYLLGSFPFPFPLPPHGPHMVLAPQELGDSESITIEFPMEEL